MACGNAAPQRQSVPRAAPTSNQKEFDREVDDLARQYIPPTVTLATAHHSDWPFVTPIMSVDAENVYRDEYLLMPWSSGEEPLKVRWYPRVGGELRYLKAVWEMVNPGKTFYGYIGFAVDTSVPLTLFRSLVATATSCGFSDAILYVRSLRAVGHIGALPLSGRHPGFAKYRDWDHLRYAAVWVEQDGNVKYMWCEGTRELHKPVRVLLGDLGNALTESLKVYGTPKTETDKFPNLVFLDGPGDLQMGKVIAALDAIQVPQRRYRMSTGEVIQIPALDTRLAFEDADLAELRSSWPSTKVEIQKIADAMVARWTAANEARSNKRD